MSLAPQLGRRVGQRAADATTRVLVGLSGGELPDAALLYAARTAARHRGVVQLLHVVADLDPGADDSRPPLVFGAVELAGERLVEAAADRIRSLGIEGIRVETTTRPGLAVRELLGASETAELVVLQHRLLSRLRRMFVGSVTVGVARRCTVPLVSVPEFWLPWPGDDLRLTVGIRDVRGQRPLLERSFAQAAEAGVALDVIHARYIPAAYDSMIAEGDSIRRWEQETHDELARQVQALQCGFPTVNASTRVVRDRPIDSLIAASRTSGMILIDRAARPEVGHLGWVTRTLLRESSCPVQVFPLGDGLLSHARA